VIPQAPPPECSCLPVGPITAADAVDVPEEVCAIEALSQDKLLCSIARQREASAFQALAFIGDGGKMIGTPASLNQTVQHVPVDQQALFSLPATILPLSLARRMIQGTQLGGLFVALQLGKPNVSLLMCSWTTSN